MSARLVVDRGWWCWLEVPVTIPGWGASPVFIKTAETPTDDPRVLRLIFVELFHSISAIERTVDLRVILQEATHIVGTLKGEDGRLHTVVLSPPDYGWLETYCARLLQWRPPREPEFQLIGEPPFPGPTPTEYLAATFGRSAPEILRGATAESFGSEKPPLPRRRSSFLLDETYSAIDSWMIARGFVPIVQEEKWFIYMHRAHLIFRRSWTGILIYDVETEWRGDQLYLGRVQVNRDPKQYSQTDDSYDRRLLAYLIAVVLLSKYAPYPVEENGSSQPAALQAWATAGKASLVGGA